MTTLTIEPGHTNLALWRKAAERNDTIELSPESWPRIAHSRAVVERALAAGRAIYGVNTGFGKLASTGIPPEDIRTLRRTVVLSHSAEVGAPLSASVVRLVLELEIGSVALGHSGV